MGAGGLALVFCTVLPWYGARSPFTRELAGESMPTSLDLWNSLDWIPILVSLTAISALAAWWLQATRPAPAFAVSLTATTCWMSLVLALVLIWRVLINVPNAFAARSGANITDARFGAYAGLVLSCTLWMGSYLSLRDDGLAPSDAPQNIETLHVAQRPTAPVSS